MKGLHSAVAPRKNLGFSGSISDTRFPGSVLENLRTIAHGPEKEEKTLIPSALRQLPKAPLEEAALEKGSVTGRFA